MIDIAALTWQCSSQHINPPTAQAIIQVESKGNPYAIDDDSTAQQYYPTSASAAVKIADNLLAEGDNLDLGLMQINSQWLHHYHLTLNDVFDSCRNIQVGTDILGNNYWFYLPQSHSENEAMFKALSAYNTGSSVHGLHYATEIMQILAYGSPGDGDPSQWAVTNFNSSHSVSTNSNPNTSSIMINAEVPPTPDVDETNLAPSFHAS